MDVYLCFPLVYFSCIQASWCYFVSKTTAVWTKQYAECNMATPTIQYEKPELYLTIDQQFQYHDLWIGYYEHMALFDYIGCIKTRNVQPILAIIQLGVPTPGRCYSACAYTQYIGISKRECYCFDTKPGSKITEQGCNSPCGDMSQTVCGGKDHISLYKTSAKDTDLVANRGDDKCLQMNFRTGEKYKWRNCNDEMWASCLSDFQQSVKIWRKSKTWNDAAKVCFKLNSYPTPVERINHVTDTNFFSWTGVVRSGVISKNADLASMSSDIMHGYMTYDDSSGYTLKFTQANDRKYILCENAKVTEASNPTITVSYATPTQVNGSIMSLNDNSYNGKNTQGSDATVVVIVSVSVVMLIVIVVVILIQVKRKKIPFLCKKELTTEEPGQKHLKSTKNPASHENHSYELVDVEDNVIGGQSADSNYTHTYNVLEEHVKDSITDDTTYDVSGNNRKTTETENENIYNKLKPDDNVTYDHAYNTTKHGLQTPDITYGTSGNAGMKPLARAAKNSDAFDENDENAYSYTLNNRPHMTTTDNVYSAHGQAGNDTRDTGEGHNDTEDAYSHINNATNGRSKQDIAYGKITEGNLKENSEGDYDVTDENSCSPNVDNEY
ncbi:uncharacterized protein LOC123559450 isoform X2 [Mercenaria mercenaria]|uniref:uncharacterized protein LOC123559450 isoform X2 n=1 Tax=Mercenaria mercenaria TaxID=6596 RepID=UPI00234F4B2B|nr:uncharacterized protein LOC123559450 isoform X2 [Mercenaria mercenaria]